MSSTTDPSVGIFTTDHELVVRSWDAWMVSATGIAESEAVGRRLGDLFPELAERGMLARMQRVIAGEGVQVLAPAFHKYVIPCPPRGNSAFERMRQHVTIAPLFDGRKVGGLIVTVQDVTARLERERELARQLESPDELTRLHAAELLAARDIPPLLGDALADDSWRVRRAAVEGMARSANPEAVEILLEAVRERHEDPALLNAALSALEGSRDDNVVTAVASLLESGDANVRIYAALALGMLRDSAAVPLLLALLNDPDTNVRFHALEALGRIGDAAAAPAVAAVAESRDFFLAFAALDALATVGDATIAPRLVPLLDDPLLLPAAATCLGAIGLENVAVPLAGKLAARGAPVGTIAAALARVHDRLEAELDQGGIVADLVRHVTGGETVAALLDALPDAHGEELVGVVRVLGWLQDEDVDRALAPLLGNAEVRDVVADTLARRGLRAADAIMGASLTGEDVTDAAAAMALGRIGSPVAVPMLINLLGADPPVIVAAAGALGAIGDRRAYEPLLALLAHAHPAVRQAGVSALSSLGHPEMEHAVARLLVDSRPVVRESAAKIAGYFGYESCLDAMIARCNDPDEGVRRTAVEHLGSYDHTAAWTAILNALLADESQAVRAGAARALGLATDARATDALLEASQDTALWVRYYATRALAHRGLNLQRVVERLLAVASGDPAPPVRIAAIEALSASGRADAAHTVEELVNDPARDVALAAITALGSFPRRGADALMHTLGSDDPGRIAAALDALAKQGNREAVPLIQQVAIEAVDEDLRAAAVRALATIGTHEAQRALVHLASSRRYRPALREARVQATEPGRGILARALAGAEAP
jgi:HEAT repeat protein